MRFGLAKALLRHHFKVSWCSIGKRIRIRTVSTPTELKGQQSQTEDWQTGPLKTNYLGAQLPLKAGKSKWDRWWTTPHC
ncbi:hypothetical protein WJX75_009419 [Coccomyxa subellipsoidea]|uniref:Uncharacterized protein n=1 Tax=Coccomyxa subellipsoidea TaxID=248742 RepID=A0ABR2YVR5_9CHLO